MPSKDDYFQPGAILHEAIVGAFHARGGGFQAWCRSVGLQPTAVRNATFGQSRGPRGKELLALAIEAAGPDFVKFTYDRRMAEAAEKIKQGAA